MALSNKNNKWPSQTAAPKARDRVASPKPALLQVGPRRFVLGFLKCALWLVLFFLPFYFLPPIFKINNFYFWRDAIFLDLVLLVVFIATLRFLLTQKVSLLTKSTPNILLLTAALIFAATLIFSQSKMASLTSLETWTYFGWLVLGFVMINNYGEISGIWRGDFGRKMKVGLLGLSVALVSLLWIVPYTPVFNKLPAQLSGYLQKPQTLDLKTSWSVAIESFKNTPLTGFGPGLYEQAFMRYKPISFNQTAGFNRIFSSTHWPFLHLLTTQGILPVLVLVFLFSWMGVMLWESRETSNTSKTEAPAERYRVFSVSPGTTRILSAIVGVILILAGAVLFKAFSAEKLYQQSLKKFANKQAVEAYNGLQQALSRNPYQSNYRRAYANLDMVLANALAVQNKNNADKSNQSKTNPQNTAQIQQLIDQAVGQTKILTEKTDPIDARNWQVRGQVYKRLIGAAQGSFDWSVKAYLQAVQLDPTDPQLRIELGGVYYLAGMQVKSSRAANKDKQAEVYLESAAEQFKMAVLAKPDLASAYYNWAAALKVLGKNDQAKAALQKTLNLIGKKSPDYEKVKKELGDIGGGALVPTPTPTVKNTAPVAVPTAAPALPSPTAAAPTPGI